MKKMPLLQTWRDAALRFGGTAEAAVPPRLLLEELEDLGTRICEDLRGFGRIWGQTGMTPLFLPIR